MSKSQQAEARRRARAARAELDASRRGREKRVDAWAEKFYLQVAAIDAAEEAVKRAQAARDEAVTGSQPAMDESIAGMLSEGETTDAVSSLLSLTKGEVSAAKRRHQSRIKDVSQSEPAGRATDDTRADEVGAA